MAASKTRMDWALFLLRLVVGLGLILHALPDLRTGGGSFQHVTQTGGALAVLMGGVLILLGLFQSVVCGVIGVLLALPLITGWIHGASPFAYNDGVLRILLVLACGLGGPGKWGLGK